MSLDVKTKRQRTSSGSTVLTARTVTDNLHRYGEIILHCAVRTTQGIRECSNSVVLKYICALLNSGGGILHMQNLDFEKTMSKHLDTWWSGMENKMVDILSRDDICNYFDLVGNYDDPDLYLFVKTAEYLCTLDYNARLPTDTATHDVTYQSVLKLLTNHGEAGCLDDLPQIPESFVYKQSAEQLKKETKQIQFKQLTSPRESQTKNSLPVKIRSLMMKYVSAFANHEGGHIFFGIDDERAAVIGEDINQSEQKRTESLVKGKMQEVIWKSESFKAERGVHWDIQFYPVQNGPKKERRMVVVVSVCKFPGGVFMSRPESYCINSEGNVAGFSFKLWKEAILNPYRDVPKLHNRFVKIPMLVPRAPLIFTLPHTAQAIKDKIFKGNHSNEILPRHFLDTFVAPHYREHVRLVLDCFTKGDNSLCLGAECWGLKMPFIQPDEVLCDVLVLSKSEGLHLVTFTTVHLPHVLQRSQMLTAMLKNKLVQNGGCAEKFGILSHVFDLSESFSEASYGLSERDLYPPHFVINPKKYGKIIGATVITLAAYSQHASELKHGSFNFLLTRDQFELLWTQQFTKELWVHGPPGAGKTVAAVQMIEELRRRGCALNQILYLAENEELCSFVRHHRICLVATRRELLDDYNYAGYFTNKYGSICSVIVDEAQNFKDRDGDWYSLAKQLANQRAPEHLSLSSNYFWVFMDYSQKVHKFQAGLPSVIGRNNFMLSEVSRNTKEIFDFTTRFMMASEDVDPFTTNLSLHSRVHSVPKLAHQFSSGNSVDIVACKESEMKSTLEKVMASLIRNGTKENDIAILVGKRSELDKLQSTVQDMQASRDESLPGNVTGPSSDLEYSGVSEVLGQQTNSRRSQYEDVSDEGCFDDSSDSEDGNITPGTSAQEQDFPVVDMATEMVSLEKDNPDASEFLQSECPSDEQAEAVAPEGNEEKTEMAGEVELEDIQTEDDARPPGVAVDTVRRFSGLDRAAVIGVNPEVNEEHADFNRFIVNLATRARDNLVIITTSESVREKLERMAHAPPPDSPQSQ